MDISQNQFALDSGALAQQNLVQYATKVLAQAKPGKSSERYRKSTNAKAQKLYHQAWTYTWTLPQIISNCTNVQFCATSDNSRVIKRYNSTSGKLSKLAIAVAKRIKRLGAARARTAQEILASANALHAGNLAQLAKVPRKASVCG